MTTTHPKVLLVDDIEANLVALEAQLGNIPCHIVRASNGNEALRQLLKQEFAVMLLDVQMPEMDGYEVASYVHDNPATRNTPIIFVTAMHKTEDGRLRGYRTGAVDFLFKPVNPYILRSKVQVFLDLYLNRRGLAEEIEAHKKTMADLEAFNYSVSHDLRAPLRPLDGFSQALLKRYGDRLDETAKHYLEEIRASALRMGELIDDMLELSRIRRAEPKWETVNLSHLVTSIAERLQQDDPSRQVQFKVAPDVSVLGDSALLQIALENLLRNAWKFTSQRQRATIEFGSDASSKGRTFFVRDDGAGFDPDYAHKLFHPFQRLHSTSEFEGTGIGLAIVDKIIEHHCGSIRAESNPDAGATFFFTLGKVEEDF